MVGGGFQLFRAAGYLLGRGASRGTASNDLCHESISAGISCADKGPGSFSVGEVNATEEQPGNIELFEPAGMLKGA